MIDMADLLDHVGGKGTSAIFIGHDWYFGPLLYTVLLDSSHII